MINFGSSKFKSLKNLIGAKQQNGEKNQDGRQA
jgi:hypothetical protein